MNVLTIETTCDETAAAIVTEELQVRASVVATQDHLHQRFGGVVPEIASRAHVERIMPVIDETLRRAGLTLADLDAVAVANTPGLAGSLLVGLTTAKALALALDIPLVAVNHLQAHVYACRIAAGEDVFPCVGMVVSGGHSSLYRCQGPIDFELLGGTIDDAAGEAFDKVAAMLGLPFPGGPPIQHAADTGNPQAFQFPRAFIRDLDRLEFSFSGLKTAVRYKIADLTENGQKALTSQQIADLCASFQAAVVDCLVAKAFLALEKTGYRTLCVGGGVAANAHFRRELERTATDKNIIDKKMVRLFIPPLRLCTDNAVMGAIAIERLKVGLVEALDLDVSPGLVRGSPARTAISN